VLATSLLLTITTAGDAVREPALQRCSFDEFDLALAQLTAKPEIKDQRNGLPLLNWTDTAAASRRYRYVVKHGASCEVQPSAVWPAATLNRTVPMIINAGEGSTATRFFWCVAKRLMLRSNHNMDGCGTRMSCTEKWGAFDYISDWPVPELLADMLATWPDALVIHALRLPEEWRKHRIEKHSRSGSAGWRQGGVCAPPNHRLDHADAPLDFVVYNAWVRCLAFTHARAAKLRGRYVAVNVFQSNHSHAPVYAILELLRQHAVALTAVLPKRFKRPHTLTELAMSLTESCSNVKENTREALHSAAMHEFGFTVDTATLQAR
jgi:hypothetical protein